MITSPHAARCDNWPRGFLGGPADLGPKLTDNLTPGSAAFNLGQRAAAMNRESKQLRAAASAAKRAARTSKPGKGSQDRRIGDQVIGSAASRRVGWGTADYAP